MKFMDQLFKRYADPFSLLNGYIRTSRMCDFVDTFCEQNAEDDRWEFFLHKVWDKSYQQYCADLNNTQDVQSMSESDIEATVKKSMDILGNFDPTQGEGEV